MADFARWAEACASGFGWERGAFVRDYEENRSDAAAAAEAAPLVPAIEAVLGRTKLGKDGFNGTAAELLDRDDELVLAAGGPRRRCPAAGIPGTGRQLSRPLYNRHVTK